MSPMDQPNNDNGNVPLNIPMPKDRLDFPSADLFATQEPRELAHAFLENNQRLLHRLERIGIEHVPYLGLHGVRDMESVDHFLHRGFSVQMVTVLTKAATPLQQLIDLYDMVGGDSMYFARRGYALTVFDLEKEGKTMAERWGSEGELKNWKIGRVGGGFPGMTNYFRSTYGLAVGTEEQTVLDFFDQTGSNIIRAHAEKTSIYFEAGKAMAHMIAVLPTDTTAIYLNETPHMYESPKGYEHGLLGHMLYVQSIIEIILDRIELRMPHTAG